MNDIFGQPNNYNGRQEDIYTRHRRHSEPRTQLQSQFDEVSPESFDQRDDSCRQLPGTIFRINIPAGATINVLNIVEFTSPTGICLILRLPFLGGECGHDH